MGLWAGGEDLGGSSARYQRAGERIRQNAEKKGFRIAERPEIVGLVDELLDACWKVATEEDLRVFKPAWAAAVQEQFDNACKITSAMPGAPEYRYLMFALAARRITQTQSWTRRNEAERHKAGLRKDAASTALEKLDPGRGARHWLEDYERERGQRTGARRDFRVTARMIGECEAVFAAWASASDADERHKKTGELQAGAEKFGDPDLYFALAKNGQAIWNSQAGAEILKQWVKRRQAEWDEKRWKIPRFCHPDPFHHPTWCEFGGSSKPAVWYAWRSDAKPMNPEPGGDADGTRRFWLLLPDFSAARARPAPMRWECKRLSRHFGEAQRVTEKPIPRADRVGLAAAGLPVRDEDGNRMHYRPEYPFTDHAKGWNARLQADRETLTKLEKQWDATNCVWRDGARALRSLRWFVTFAPALATSKGPGRTIHPKLGWRSEPHAELNEKQEREGHAKLMLPRLPGLRVLSVDLGHRCAAACAVWETLTGEQMKAACLHANHAAPAESDLSLRLPATGTDGKTRTAIYRRIGADQLDGKDHPAPWARLVRTFLIKLQGEDHSAREASNEETWRVHQIKKDLGLAVPLVDRLTRAGWGTTDRQAQRLEALKQLGWEQSGCNPLAALPVPSLGVNELLFATVRNVRLALRRHSDRARIAFGLTADHKPMPGDKAYFFALGPGQRDDFDDASDKRTAEHTQFLQDLLSVWYDLAVSRKWRDKDALAWWNDWIMPIIKQSAFTPPPPLSGKDLGDKDKAKRYEDRVSRWNGIWKNQLGQKLSPPDPDAEDLREAPERKADRDAIRAMLAPVAETLRCHVTLRQELHELWARRWLGDEGTRRWNLKNKDKSDFTHTKSGKSSTTAPKEISATGFHRILAVIRDWLVPGGLRSALAKPMSKPGNAGLVNSRA